MKIYLKNDDGTLSKIGFCDDFKIKLAGEIRQPVPIRQPISGTGTIKKMWINRDSFYSISRGMKLKKKMRYKQLERAIWLMRRQKKS